MIKEHYVECSNP